MFARARASSAQVQVQTRTSRYALTRESGCHGGWTKVSRSLVTVRVGESKGSGVRDGLVHEVLRELSPFADLWRKSRRRDTKNLVMVRGPDSFEFRFVLMEILLKENSMVD